MSEFVPYETFATSGELKEFVELLEANNVAYELEDDIRLVDASFANPNHHRDYRIKLQAQDFERVNEIRNNAAFADLNQVDPGYYLFDFTDEELIDLISKQDEWSPFDFQLAQKILKERGREITTKEIHQMKEQRIEELSEPEKHTAWWIGLGYVFAFLGGLIGIIIGYYLISSKKVLPTGEKIYTYSESDRKHGAYILLIAIAAIIIGVAFRIINKI